MVVSSLYNIVDQIFIGRGVGYLGNAATTVSYPFVTICMAIALTIGIGTAARYSLSLGKKQQEEAAAAVGGGITMMFVFGTLYGVLLLLFHRPLLIAFGASENVLDYAVSYTSITAVGMPFLIVMNGCSNIARADGSPLYSMTTMLIGALINTVLDPFFIFVCHWGVAGAAWATVIGQIVSCGFAMLYLRRIKRVSLHKRHFRISLKQIGKTASMGMSNGLTQISITLLQVVLNRSLVYYGGMTIYGSDIPLAACGIVMKVNAIVLAVIIGIIQGMQPIIGFNYGAAAYQRVKATYKLAVLCVTVITLTGLIVFQFFPETVLSVFGSEEDSELYKDFAVLFMKTFLFMLPLAGIQMISSNFFSSIGKPLKGTILSLTRQVFFLIPLLLIFPLFWGLDGILFAAPVSDALAFFVVLGFIVYEMRNMTKKEQSLPQKNS